MEHISITGDYKDGCEVSLCLNMDVKQRGKVSSLTIWLQNVWYSWFFGLGVRVLRFSLG
jgi:hypothetical protein